MNKNLTTNYLGLKLKNPLIASSSGLTDQFAKIKLLEEKGISAVVLKSIFEEQILMEIYQYPLDENSYTDAYEYISNYVRSKNVNDYLELINQSKKNTIIPIIASVNCITSREWIMFTKNIEAAGADALELNIFYLPIDKYKTSLDYENLYYDIVENVVNNLNIPISVKISQHLTNPLNFVENLKIRGVKGITLFNRFYKHDIDIENFSFTTGEIFSVPNELSEVLRWTGIISGKIEDIDISTSTGVYEYNDVIKCILSGATTVQLCSVLYKYGIEKVSEILNNLNLWLDNKKIYDISEIRGKLNYKNINDPATYERVQFMKYFSNYK